MQIMHAFNWIRAFLATGQVLNSSSDVILCSELIMMMWFSIPYTIDVS